MVCSRKTQDIFVKAFKVLRYRGGLYNKFELRDILQKHSDLSFIEASQAILLLKEQGKIIENPLEPGTYLVLREEGVTKNALSRALNNILAKDPEFFEILKNKWGEEFCQELKLELKGNPDSRWNLFRKLLDYYIDVSKFSGGKGTFSLDEYNVSFSFINALPNFSICYNDFRQGLKRARLDLAKEPPFFSKPKWPLVIGYPLELYKDKEGQIQICPVFEFYLDNTESRWSKFNPYIYALDQAEVVLNNRWLESRKPKGNDLNDLLEFNEFIVACGVDPRRFSEDDVLEDLVTYGSLQKKTWSKYLEVLQHYFSQSYAQSIDLHLIKLPKIDELKKLVTTEKKIYNFALIGMQEGSNFTKSLIKELEILKDPEICPDEVLDNTALSYFFKEGSDLEPQAFKADLKVIFENKERRLFLNDSQQDAVASILNEPLSLIQGPPGTGKTQVIVNSVYNLDLYKQKSLVTTLNHAALEALTSRFRGTESEVPLVKESDLLSRLAEFNKNAYQDQEKVAEFDERATYFYHKLEKLLELLGLLDDLSYKLSVLKIKEALFLNAKALFLEHKVKSGKTLKEHLASFTFNEQDKKSWLEGSIEDLDPRQLSLKEKLLALIFRHSANKTPLEDLIERLAIKKLLKGKERAQVLKFLDELVEANLFEISEQGIAKSAQAILDLFDKEFLEFEDKITFKETLAKELTVVECENLVSSIKDLVPLLIESVSKDASAFFSQEVKKENFSPKTYQMQAKLESLLRNPEWLNELYSKNYQEDWSKIKSLIGEILAHFRQWAIATLSGYKGFPFIAGIFDIAIFDEAGKSDFISAIPILYRSKRVAIVGDPKQLKPIKKIGLYQDKRLLIKHNLRDFFVQQKYGANGKCLYSFVKEFNKAQEIFLNESMRSTAKIVNYISTVSYNGKLLPKCDESRLIVPQKFGRGIHWYHTEGPCATMKSSRYCEAEASKVLEMVRDLKGENFKGTIGIISPYKAQTNYIEKLCRDEFSPEFCKNLKISTVHYFQGYECDVIILTLCLSEHGNAFIQNDLSILNVAVSRARSTVICVGNLALALNCSFSPLQELAKRGTSDETRQEVNQSFYEKAHLNPQVTDLFESPYEEILYQELCKLGLKPRAQMPAGRRRLDLALVDSGRYLDIEVDGSCHRGIAGARKADDYVRDLELKNLGFEVIRFWTDEIRFDREACAKKVKEVFESMSLREGN